MKKNTAAFIMPVYCNNLKSFKPFFVKAIDSVLKQTDQDFILIIVDDCSKDTKVKKFIIEQAKKDLRIKTIFSHKNLGSGLARNLGIDLAHKLKCPFILYNDSDDISDPNRLKETRKAFKNPNVNVVYSSFVVINENDNIISENKLCPSVREIIDGHKKDVVEGENAWLKIALEKNYTNLTSTTAVRTSLAYLEKFPKFRVSEDAHAWFRYGAHKGTFKFLKNIITKYRIVSNQESSCRTVLKNFYHNKAITDVDGYLKAESIYLKENPGIDKKQLDAYRAKFYYREALSIMRGFDYKTAADLLIKSLKINPKVAFDEINKFIK